MVTPPVPERAVFGVPMMGAVDVRIPMGRLWLGLRIVRNCIMYYYMQYIYTSICLYMSSNHVDARLCL